MRLFLIIISILIVILLGIYTYLGGFEQPFVYKTELPSYLVAGKFYQGKSNDEALGKLFYELKVLHDKQELPGTLTAVYYQINSKVRDTTQVFLGVAVKDSLKQLPSGYQYRIFLKSAGIRANIICHPYVMPRPETMQTKIKDFADKQGVKTQNYVMEKYVNEKTFEVEVPIAP